LAQPSTAAAVAVCASSVRHTNTTTTISSRILRLYRPSLLIRVLGILFVLRLTRQEAASGATFIFTTTSKYNAVEM